MHKPQLISRLLVLISTVLLGLVYLFPMWKIEFFAPQYPEGLELKIMVNDIGGDVEVINGLNHYIGMKTLHAEDFLEFTVLPYIVAVLIVLSLITLMLNRRKWINIFFWIFTVIAVVCMADFYRWEYEYGHNLNPTAPIKVPGSSYQPPFIGYKKLLNFGVYSIPDLGGWFYIGAGVCLGGAALLEWRKSKREKKIQHSIQMKHVSLAVLGFAILASCSTGPRKVDAGNDDCAHCKMTITDTKFAVQIVNTKGKSFFFDDMICALDFVSQGGIKKDEIAQIYCADYSSPENWIKAEEGSYMSGPNLRSPMGGNMAAFSNAQARDSIVKELSGYAIEWKDIYHP